MSIDVNLFMERVYDAMQGKPEAPTPAAFGLTQSEVERFRQDLEVIDSNEGLVLTWLKRCSRASDDHASSSWSPLGDLPLWLYVPLSPLLMCLLFLLMLGAMYAALIGMYALGAILIADALVWTVAKPYFRRRVFQRAGYRSFREFEAAVESHGQAEREYIRTREDYWHSLSGRRFEAELAEVYRTCGYEVIESGGSGDEGVDLVLSCEGMTTVVQCKRHKKPVGPAVARELFGALTAHGADDAILACPSGFTRGVHQFVQGKPIKLLDASAIVSLQLNA